MATLYHLSLSKPPKGFGKPCVHAVPTTGMVGHYCPELKTLVVPDMGAVRACLPHYYRAAFDRRVGTFWFPNTGWGSAHVTLWDARGHWLNTLYAKPYTYR